MSQINRRIFLADVGKGMMVASLGATVASELGLSPALAGEFEDRLTFGKLEPLVSLMQDTPAAELQPMLVEKLKAGTSLKTLIAAGALANSRTFGGTDYTGYHAMMALSPAYEMSQQLPASRAALPVLKVLYRNSERIQAVGGRTRETMLPAEPAAKLSGAECLREMVRKGDMAGAERVFAKLAQGPLPEAYHSLLFVVQDDVDVHRVVLAWRAWDTLKLTGMKHAHTLLRQSVRHCVDREQESRRRGRSEPRIRKLLPRLLDEYKLLGKPVGDRQADDGWVERMSGLIFAGSREKAAEAVAGALADGFLPEQIGEALSLASARLVLHDPGRRSDQPGKPRGSVHGASVGVHSSDAVNAWRNIVRVSDHRNVVASLIVGAYHTAGQKGEVWDEPLPYASAKESVTTQDPAELLKQANEAVRNNDQTRACAVIDRYGQLGGDPTRVFNLMLRFAVSEDGALHAEKYFRTVTEEFATTRPTLRWRHLVALARVTASEYGHPAPGREEARRLLGVV